jgi:hypothetical protein
MKEEDYTVENLVNIFFDHAKMSEDHVAKLKEEFIKNFPDQPIPGHLDEGFNLAKALSVLCSEIAKLKIRCN